jgi:hypothetical protein
MEQREREELGALLHAVTPLNTDLSKFPVLTAYLRRLLARAGAPQGATDFDAWVVALIFEAAQQEGGLGKPRRRDGAPTHPLRAAEHLLGLGDYPADINHVVPGTSLSLLDVNRRQRRKPLTKRTDPRSGPFMIRSALGVSAAGYGDDRSGLNRGKPRFNECVDALAKEIESLVKEPDLLVRLERRIGLHELSAPVSDLGVANDPLATAVEQAGDAGVAQRSPKLSRPRWLVTVAQAIRTLEHQSHERIAEAVRESRAYRAKHPLLGRLRLAASWTLAIVVVFGLPLYFAGSSWLDRNFAFQNNVDPALAKENGEDWSPGWGPDRDQIPWDQDLDGAAFNANTIDPSSWPGFASGAQVFLWVRQGDSFSESFEGWERSVWARGSYEGRIYVENSGTRGIEGARVRIGTIVSGVDDRAMFVRLSGSNASTVWDGVDVGSRRVRIRIDEDSLVVVSAAHPEGVHLSGEALTASGALIGSGSALNGEIDPSRRDGFYILFDFTIDWPYERVE